MPTCRTRRRVEANLSPDLVLKSHTSLTSETDGVFLSRHSRGMSSKHSFNQSEAEVGYKWSVVNVVVIFNVKPWINPISSQLK